MVHIPPMQLSQKQEPCTIPFVLFPASNFGEKIQLTGQRSMKHAGVKGQALHPRADWGAQLLPFILRSARSW